MIRLRAGRSAAAGPGSGWSPHWFPRCPLTPADPHLSPTGGQQTPSYEDADASTPYTASAGTPGAVGSEAPASPSSSANTDAHTLSDAPGPYIPVDREWLYRLVTFPSYFTPCPSCCGTNKAPKREQLVTHFDTAAPYEVYCSHCPEHKTHATTLLQVRQRSMMPVVQSRP